MLKTILFTKTIYSTLLTFLAFGAMMCVPYTPAQDSPQCILPPNAIACLGRGSPVEVTYSPDGTQFAVATQIGIWRYDARTQAELDMLPVGAYGVHDITYSPDGRLLAGAMRTYAGNPNARSEVWVWDVATGQLKTTLTKLVGGFLCIAFSPDGRTLASGSADPKVWLWDIATGREKATLTGHTNGVKSVAFSSDGRTLASGSLDSTVRLWDVATGREKATLTGHTNGVESVAFSPDGRTLASGSPDSTVRLWDVATGHLKTTFTDEGNWIYSVAFSPDGRTLASGSYQSKVKVWDVATGREKTTLTADAGQQIRSVAFSPDGRTLISAAGGEIRLWDVASRREKTTPTGYTSEIQNVVFSPDGRTLASGSRDDTVRLWDVAAGREKAILTGYTGTIRRRSIAFSPDGRTLAGGGAGLWVWDVATGQLKTTLTEHTGFLESLAVAFSPDGRLLAGGGAELRVWDVATGQLKTTLTGHTGFFESLAFSPDGRMLAGGGGAGLWVWDIATGHLKTTLTEDARIRSVAFSPDGRTLASGSEEIRLWNPMTGEPKAIHSGTYGFSNRVDVAFSPNGQMLATQGPSGQEIMLWDTVSGQHQATFAQRSTYVTSFAFSPDGYTFATGTRDGTIHLWRLPLEVLQQPDPMVRVVYFRPNDSVPQQNINTHLDTLIKETQQFCADQMENHGFGRKTFTFEADATENAVVHHVVGQGPAADYLQRDLFHFVSSIQNELTQRFLEGSHIYLIALDMSLEIGLGREGYCGVASPPTHSAFDGQTFQQHILSFAFIPAAGSCSDVAVAAHEIGHACGLSHDYRDKNYVMYDTQIPDRSLRLSYLAAQWLDAHPCWNPGQNRFNNPGTIEILSTDASRFQFKVTDTDGLQQVQLIVKEITNPDNVCGYRWKLQDNQILNRTSSGTVEFTLPSTIAAGTLMVMDTRGNIAIKADIPITRDVALSMDANADSVVNIADVVFVAARLGQMGQGNPADVNGDGVVNIADIVLVAGALGNVNGAAAPTPHLQPPEMFTPEVVQRWLAQAQQLGLTDATSQRGIRFLQQLLVALTPKETAVLPNYPNPFNPETWIPYHLAKPADVTLRIYAADGKLVQTLALGHQPVGVYESKSRAAYWDGRNAIGERVASGLYFYTLTAGEFAATQKMLILK